MCSRIKSSFPGKISEVPGIAADNFEGDNLKSRAFFLSHCHSDHTRGLFSKELLTVLKSNEIFIYMSDLSAAIVADDCKNDSTLMKYIKPLDSGPTYLTLPKLFGYDEEFIKVTLIPAGHCLGSVMFLFKTNYKTVLYTGDFNISSNDICQVVALHDENKKPINIDTIYIDTTFLSYEYEYFPKRSEVINELISIIKNWLEADKRNRVALSVSAKYGYEYIFHEIYKNLNQKVYVNEERWAFYSAHQNLCNGVTNNELDSKIHICRNTNISKQHNWCSINHIDGYDFLFIRFSAMTWNGYKYEATGIRRPSNGRVDVCFATHCSSIQIKHFVNYFSPKKVVGFPHDYVGDSSSSTIYFKHKVWPRKRKVSPIKVSNSDTRDKKIDQKILKIIFDV